MRMAASALLLVAVGLAPSVVEANSGKKKLPKPNKMVNIRPHDADRLAKLTKISAKYGPAWGVPKPLSEQPLRAHMGHYVEYED